MSTFLSLIVWGMALTAGGDARTAQPVIARVNGEAITASDLEAVLASRHAELATAYAGEDLDARMAREKGEVLHTLIEQKLLVQAARRELSRRERERIARHFDRFSKLHPERMRSTLALARRASPTEEISPEEREELIDILLVEELVRRKTHIDPLTFSPRAVWEYYEDHPEEFQAPETRELRVIFVDKTAHDTFGEARRIAREALTQVRASVDFEAVARAYGDGPLAEEGGLWKGVRRGMLRSEIDAAAFALKKGERTDCIETREGYFIIKAESIVPPRTVPFEEARDGIRERMTRDLVAEKTASWLRELKKEARIEILAAGGTQ